jgi:hypothetical protein
MKSIFIIFGLFFINVSNTYSQSKEDIRQEQDSIYKTNITKVRLNGKYIPKDLEDAFKELDELSPPKELTKIKLADEDLIAKKLHFGLGRWMAYNWNFDLGSRFSHYLTINMNLRYTDDMIDFMLRVYHRYLNNKPQDAINLGKSYQKKRDDAYAAELKKKYGIDSIIRIK